MSIKCITSNEAYNLADKIATKAFEHLLTPLYTAQNLVGKEAYEAIIEGVGGELVVRKLIAFGMAAYAETVTLDIQSGVSNAKEVSITYKVENDTLLNCRRWDNPCIVDGALYDRALDLNTQVYALNNKRNALENTLRQQMQGKSAKTVIKAWPEAESILNGYYGAVTDSTLVSPLDELLSRFIPMLAAPQGA